MARSRNIKPGFFQNDDLGELPPLARLLFIGMWTIADYKGCLEFRAKRLKVQLLPYDECDVDQLARALDKSGFIAIYSVQGQQYIKIKNFEKHQNPHKNEREAGSEIPDISEKDCEIKDLSEIEINRDKNGTAPADSLLLIPDSLLLIPDSLNPQPDSKGSKPASGMVPFQPDRRKEKRTVSESKNAETWNAYCEAYRARYQVDPVRNATTNAQMANFVSRLGIEEAPHVARFYVAHNKAWYVQQSHAIGPMLSDAEGLRTQWATGNRVTAARAQQMDRTQTNGDVFAELIAEAREKKHGNESK